jgi:hypothetical protein
MNLIDRLLAWVRGLVGRGENLDPAAFSLISPAWDGERILYGGVLPPTKLTAVHYVECRRLSMKEAKLSSPPGRPLLTHHIRIFYRLLKDGREINILNQPYAFSFPGFSADGVADLITRDLGKQLVRAAAGGVDSGLPLPGIRLIFQGYQATIYWQSFIEAKFRALIARRYA